MPNTYQVNDALEPFVVPIDSLKPDPDNSNVHSAKNLKAIADSLAASGQQTPIVYGQNKIVRKGNGTLRAAKEILGWTHIAAVPFTLSTPHTVDEERQYAVRDNRTGELAEWDFDQLQVDLRDWKESGEDLTTLGWDEAELATIIQADFNPDTPGDLPEGGSDGKSVHFTDDQWAIVRNAVEDVRAENADEDEIGVARALQVVCERYMAPEEAG
jgi:hypothetical protein